MESGLEIFGITVVTIPIVYLENSKISGHKYSNEEIASEERSVTVFREGVGVKESKGLKC